MERKKERKKLRERKITSNDLTTTTLAVLGTFNNSWEIKNLELCSMDTQHTGDSGQRGELIGGHFRISACEARHERRLANRGESNEANASNSSLGNIKALKKKKDEKKLHKLEKRKIKDKKKIKEKNQGKSLIKFKKKVQKS